jgi:hypothetical protein
MKAFLLTVALLLMAAALSTPLWVRPSRSIRQLPRSHKVVVSGRIKGEFPDAPWFGMILLFGSEKIALKADGKFSFSVMPGTHILKLCCSQRFRQIYREIEVEDRDLYFELEARPLLKIAGHLSTPREKPLEYALNVSAWLIGTNTVDRTVVASDGSFAFHLTEGDWRLELDNLKVGYVLHSITLDGVEVRNQQFTVSNVYGPALPLRITLK